MLGYAFMLVCLTVVSKDTHPQLAFIGSLIGKAHMLLVHAVLCVCAAVGTCRGHVQQYITK